MIGIVLIILIFVFWCIVKKHWIILSAPFLAIVLILGFFQLRIFLQPSTNLSKLEIGEVKIGEPLSKDEVIVPDDLMNQKSLKGKEVVIID